MTYAQKLKDPRWQRSRLEVLERYNWTCCWCDSKSKTFHVHHNFYIAGLDPWDYEIGQLCALCEDCHEKMGKIQSRMKIALSFLGPADFSRILGYAEAAASFDPTHGFSVAPPARTMSSYFHGVENFIADECAWTEEPIPRRDQLAEFSRLNPGDLDLRLLQEALFLGQETPWSGGS